MIRLRLTAAQRSALECAGLELAETPEERALAAAWRGASLIIEPGQQEILFSALNERSNAEDAAAQLGDRFARHAALALGNLASKVLRA